MLPPHLEEIVGRIRFREPAAARVRLEALAADPSELLTLERLGWMRCGASDGGKFLESAWRTSEAF